MNRVEGQATFVVCPSTRLLEPSLGTVVVNGLGPFSPACPGALPRIGRVAPRAPGGSPLGATPYGVGRQDDSVAASDHPRESRRREQPECCSALVARMDCGASVA